jgi:hypothetical protein
MFSIGQILASFASEFYDSIQLIKQCLTASKATSLFIILIILKNNIHKLPNALSAFCATINSLNEFCVLITTL